MALYYRQPKYFDKFKCIGGACEDNCCHAWNICWYDWEYEKLKNTECSQELRELAGKSFKKNDDGTYSIVFGENGYCPMQTQEGLCMVQKELGAEYLSETCQVYPRKYFVHNETVIRSCFSSCVAVLDLLSNDANAVRLESKNVESDFHYRLSSNVDTKERLAEYKPLSFRVQLMDFYNKLMTDRSLSLETATVLGALASKRFTDASDSDRVVEIAKIIKEYEEKIHDKATIKAIEDIKPNPAVQFKFVNNLLMSYFSSESGIKINISNLHDGEKLIAENYKKGLKLLNEAFKGKEYFFKNIAANMLLELSEPFYMKDATILENYSYFTLAVATIKLLGISVALRSDNIERDFKKSIAILHRIITHDSNNAQKVIGDMKKHGFTSVAHIAMLIK